MYTLTAVGLLILGIALGTFLAADVILLVFGSEYALNASLVLRLLALSIPLLAVGELFVAVARVHLANPAVISFYAVRTTFALGLSHQMGFRWGLTGFGLGWLAAQGLVALLAVVLLTRLPQLSQPMVEERPIQPRLENTSPW